MVGVGIVLMEAVTGVLGFDVHPLSVKSTKYVVVEFKFGVVKLAPFAKLTPPLKAEYQFKVPEAAFA